MLFSLLSVLHHVLRECVNNRKNNEAKMRKIYTFVKVFCLFAILWQNYSLSLAIYRRESMSKFNLF